MSTRQLDFFAPAPSPIKSPRRPAGDIQVRCTTRPHVCVCCGLPVPKGDRAEVWPDGAAHISCGIAARRDW